MSDSSTTGDFDRGRALWELGRAGDAVPFLRRAVAAQPSDYLTWCWLSLTLATLRQWDEARRCAERAIEVAPDQEWPHRLRARISSQRGHEGVAASGQEAIRAAPQSALTLADIAFAYAQDHPHKALAAADQAVALDPEDHFVWAAKAWAEHRSGDNQAAEASHLRVLQLNPNGAMWHNNYGVTLIALERYREAVSCFRRALELDPVHVYAGPNLGKALGLAGDIEQGRDAFRHAAEAALHLAEQRLRESSLDGAAHADRALALVRLGRLEEALEAIDASIDLVPDDPAAHLLRSALFEEAGELELAKAAALDAYRLNPSRLWTFELLASICASLGEPGCCKWAVRHLEALGGEGDSLAAARAYASAAILDWAEVERWLTEALPSHPLSCAQNAWLGVAKYELGDRVGADEQYRRVCAICPVCDCPRKVALRCRLEGS